MQRHLTLRIQNATETEIDTREKDKRRGKQLTRKIVTFTILLERGNGGGASSHSREFVPKMRSRGWKSSVASEGAWYVLICVWYYFQICSGTFLAISWCPSPSPALLPMCGWYFKCKHVFTCNNLAVQRTPSSVSCREPDMPWPEMVSMALSNSVHHGQSHICPCKNETYQIKNTINYSHNIQRCKNDWNKLLNLSERAIFYSQYCVLNIENSYTHVKWLHNDHFWVSELSTTTTYILFTSWRMHLKL